AIFQATKWRWKNIKFKSLSLKESTPSKLLDLYLEYLEERNYIRVVHERKKMIYLHPDFLEATDKLTAKVAKKRPVVFENKRKQPIEEAATVESVLLI